MANQYLLHLPDGTEYGPVDRATLEAWSREGRLPAETLVWPEGAPEWMALEKALAAPAPRGVARARPAAARPASAPAPPAPVDDRPETAALDAHARLRRQGARAARARRAGSRTRGGVAGRVAQPRARPRGDRGRRGGPRRPVGRAAPVPREAAGDRRGPALRAAPTAASKSRRPASSSSCRPAGWPCARTTPSSPAPARACAWPSPRPGPSAPSRSPCARGRWTTSTPTSTSSSRSASRACPRRRRESGPTCSWAAGAAARSAPPGRTASCRCRARSSPGRTGTTSSRSRPGRPRRRETPSRPSWTRCAVGSPRRARSKRASTRRWSAWRWRCRNFPGTRSVFSWQSA